jgi:hypothetical protein
MPHAGMRIGREPAILLCGGDAMAMLQCFLSVVPTLYVLDLYLFACPPASDKRSSEPD